MADPKEVLCSRASVLAGGKPITSFTDGSIEAAIAATLYEGLAKAALCNFPWSFAMAEQELEATLADPPLGAWAYAYEKPNEPEPLRIWSLLKNDQPVPFVQKGSQIHTDADTGESPPVLQYTYRADETEWASDFAQALVWELAIAYAAALDREGKISTFQTKALQAWAVAKNANSTSQSNKRFIATRLIANR